MLLPHDSVYFLGKLRTLHLSLRDYLRDQLLTQDPNTLSALSPPRDGDIIYRIDEKGESILFEFCSEWSKETPFTLIAEGIPGDGWKAFPEGSTSDDSNFLLIVDPIDGTRSLMYDKRSAWILSGIAPNYGRQTTMSEIGIAMQTEIPTTRQYLCAHLWAVEGQGAKAESHDILHHTVKASSLRPSGAQNIEHGFSCITKFFPAGKRQLVEIEERLFERLLGEKMQDNPTVFDDQYISSGGQLWELMCGHDRFIADLRPQIDAGDASPLCAHPYDLCTELIAREAGVSITNEHGDRLKNLLDIRENISWVGYANPNLKALIQPALESVLKEMKWHK